MTHSPLSNPPSSGQNGALPPQFALPTPASPLERSGQPLIMAIDDSHAVRLVIEASFRRANFQSVVTYPDGLSAIKALSMGEVTVPDLVLLDIGMPNMDGYEVARILRTNSDFAQTQIVMLTGRDSMLDHLRSKMVGARDFIPKPFRPADLVRRVFTLLDYMPPGF